MVEPRTTEVATAAALVLGAVTLAACGGGSGGGDTASLLARPKHATLTQTHPKEAPASKRRAPGRTRTRHRHPQAARRHSAGRAHAPKPLKPTAAQRAKIENLLAVTVLNALGFTNATVTVKATTLTVAIPRSAACAGGAATLRKRLATALPTIKSIRLTIRGTGDPFAAYVAAHCARLMPPTLGGRIVFEQKGSGATPTKTKTFRIRSKLWSVAYVNEGPYFQAFVLKDGRPLTKDVFAKKRRSGSERFTGPGEFALQIVGSQDWVVQVHDGA